MELTMQVVKRVEFKFKIQINIKKKDVVKEVFESAKKHGAKPVTELEDEKLEKDKFGGVGYKLGNAIEPSKPDPSTLIKQPEKKKQPISKSIYFWKNGFSVDEGPLRSFDDPKNAAFLKDIHHGFVPRELESEAQGQELQINLVDKKNEEYKEPPKPKIVAFSGKGQSLGSTSTSITSTNNNITSYQSFDESKPFTSIQIRLHDGTRLVSKFNHTQTISDIRRFVEAAKKLPQGTQYDLLTSFPTKILTDNSQNIKDAGLINAVLQQKLK